MTLQNRKGLKIAIVTNGEIYDKERLFMAIDAACGDSSTLSTVSIIRIKNATGASRAIGVVKSLRADVVVLVCPGSNVAVRKAISRAMRTGELSCAPIVVGDIECGVSISWPAKAVRQDAVSVVTAIVRYYDELKGYIKVK